MLVEKGLRFALMMLIARALAPEQFGQYGNAVTQALLLVQITDLGLGLFLAREIARDSVPAGHLVGHVFTLKAALGTVYLLAMALLTWANRDQPTVAWTVAFAGISSLVVTTIEAICQVFRGVQRLELEARSGAVHALLQVTLVGGSLIWWRHVHPIVPDTQSAMVVVAATMCLASSLALVYSARLLMRMVKPQYGFSRQILSRFGREVLPLGVAIMASMAYFKIDVLMLTWMRGPTETGVYQLAYKLFENLSMVPAVLLAATFPALSLTVQDDPRAAFALHKVTLRILVVAGLCAMVGLVALPHLGLEPAVVYLLGPGYARSMPVLVALAPSVLLTFVNYLETHMLVALGMVWRQMAVTLALVLVNVGVNAVLIPRYGGVGAALATAATELVLFLFAMPMVRHALRQRIARAEAAA